MPLPPDDVVRRPGEAWWQRITGRPLIGDLVGRQLTVLPAEIVAFGDFYFVALRDAPDVDEEIRYWLAEAYVPRPTTDRFL